MGPGADYYLITQDDRKMVEQLGLKTISTGATSGTIFGVP